MEWRKAAVGRADLIYHLPQLRGNQTGWEHKRRRQTTNGREAYVRGKVHLCDCSLFYKGDPVAKASLLNVCIYGCRRKVISDGSYVVQLQEKSTDSARDE